MNAKIESSTQISTAKRVLVVEDERKTYEGWVEELKNRGIDSDVAANPDEAVEKLCHHAYSVVILDLMLPRGSSPPKSGESRFDVGVEILSRIRQGEFVQAGTPADIAVIVCTAVADSSVMDKLKILKVEQVYSKPESPRVVAEHVKILIEQTADQS